MNKLIVLYVQAKDFILDNIFIVLALLFHVIIILWAILDVKMQFVDALYFAVATMSTTGNPSLNPQITDDRHFIIESILALIGIITVGLHYVSHFFSNNSFFVLLCVP